MQDLAYDEAIDPILIFERMDKDEAERVKRALEEEAQTICAPLANNEFRVHNQVVPSGSTFR